jgi:hypothetical protein
MKGFLLAAVLAAFAGGGAYAQSTSQPDTVCNDLGLGSGQLDGCPTFYSPGIDLGVTSSVPQLITPTVPNNSLGTMPPLVVPNDPFGNGNSGLFGGTVFGNPTVSRPAFQLH